MPRAHFSICAFDLETTDLCADRGILLCAVLKDPDHGPTVLRIDECSADWAADPQDDHRLVDQVARRLETYEVWVAFNGTGFDVPFLRSRLAHWRLQPLAARTLIDPCLLARRNLRLSRNSLAALAAYLGLGRKYPLAPSVSARAALRADREALDQIVEHCKNDLVLLERLIPHLAIYSPHLNRWHSS